VILTDAERAKITRCIDEHGGVCREVMCDDSLDVLVDQIVRGHAAMAWDQGWAALREFAGDDLPERPRNPYRTRVIPPGLPAASEAGA
jgi:hypothetical protein